MNMDMRSSLQNLATRQMNGAGYKPASEPQPPLMPVLDQKPLISPAIIERGKESFRNLAERVSQAKNSVKQKLGTYSSNTVKGARNLASKIRLEYDSTLHHTKVATHKAIVAGKDAVVKSVESSVKAINAGGAKINAAADKAGREVAQNIGNTANATINDVIDATEHAIDTGVEQAKAKAGQIYQGFKDKRNSAKLDSKLVAKNEEFEVLLSATNVRSQFGVDGLRAYARDHDLNQALGIINIAISRQELTREQADNAPKIITSYYETLAPFTEITDRAYDRATIENKKIDADVEMKLDNEREAARISATEDNKKIDRKKQESINKEANRIERIKAKIESRYKRRRDPIILEISEINEYIQKLATQLNVGKVELTFTINNVTRPKNKIILLKDLELKLLMLPDDKDKQNLLYAIDDYYSTQAELDQLEQKKAVEIGNLMNSQAPTVEQLNNQTVSLELNLAKAGKQKFDGTSEIQLKKIEESLADQSEKTKTERHIRQQTLESEWKGTPGRLSNVEYLKQINDLEPKLREISEEDWESIQLAVIAGNTERIYRAQGVTFEIFIVLYDFVTKYKTMEEREHLFFEEIGAFKYTNKIRGSSNNRFNDEYDYVKYRYFTLPLQKMQQFSKNKFVIKPLNVNGDTLLPRETEVKVLKYMKLDDGVKFANAFLTNNIASLKELGSDEELEKLFDKFQTQKIDENRSYENKLQNFLYQIAYPMYARQIVEYAQKHFGNITTNRAGKDSTYRGKIVQYQKYLENRYREISTPSSTKAAA